MNIVFITINNNQEENENRFKLFKSYADKHHNLPTKNITERNSEVKIAYCSNKGKLIGYAEKDNVHLILNGFIYSPVPGWDKSSSPLDDPDVTAAFLLEKYLKDGDTFTKNIYGHYSVVVHDSKKQKTLLVRDPDGQNDLFIYKKGKEIIFSNKVRPIVESLDNKAELDRSYEDFFLIYGFYPYGNTMYKNISIIPKDKVTIYQKANLSDKSLTHSPKGSILHVSDEKTLIEQLHKAMQTSLKNILPTKEKKVAVLLGGFDSALVASMLVKEGKKVETFSFYYENEKFNQNHTETIAKHLGIKHNWIKVDEKIFESYLKNFPLIFNYPTNWPSYVMQTAYLCKVIRDKGFNYCYTGDGCDSLFYGFPLTFKRAEIMSTLGSLPNPILDALIKIAERPSLERTLGRPHQVVVGSLRSSKRAKDERTFLTFRIFNEGSLRQLRKDPKPAQAEHLEKTVSKLVSNYKGISPVRMAYEGKNMVAPSRNKLNGSADLSGLVIMSPYTHQDLKAFVKKIPDRLLRPENADTPIGKYILSKMAEKKKLLPKEVIYQPKMAASDSPLQQWYNGKLNEPIYEFLDDLPFVYSERYVKSLIKETRAEKLYSSFMSRETNNIMTLAHCISLLLTYSRFTNIKGTHKD